MCKILGVGSGEPNQHSRSLVWVLRVFEEDIGRAGLEKLRLLANKIQESIQAVGY